MRPNELYAILPGKIDYDLDCLFGCHYSHIPELDDIGYNSVFSDKSHIPNTRVSVFYYKEFYFDHRRFWKLFSLKFDDVFVMICQNAGREGDDHVGRFITNPEAYGEMVKYIRSLFPVKIGTITDIVGADVDITGLVDFYGNKLDGAFERF